ncbi:hypothetical protein OUZ56_005427 [Daphnia magna]|uniref:Uncharacterized protein n=1 Tax=Daphnia magna TaxID=35525 RepID=A0ABQ9YSZ7_9CRUS|nr:hypothetical protein OUZ56_005427 [Daphnia magna]
MANFGNEDERSQDGSTASISRPLTKHSKVMIVFDFMEHSPGIGLISHVVKPVLPEIEEDAVPLVKMYIEKHRNAIRWKPPLPTDTSSWHLTQYSNLESCKNTIIRQATAVCISDDKDILSNQRTALIKYMMSQNDRRVSGRPRARTQLQYLTNMEQLSTASNTSLDENVESSEAEPLTNQKATYEDVERELAESDAKRIKLEIDQREMQQRIIALEEEIKTLKEDPVRNTYFKFIDGSATDRPTVGQLPGTPRPSPGSKVSTTPDTFTPQFSNFLWVKFHAWYEPAELAQFSLAGKACPSIPGSIPKPKFPEDILEAIERFLIPKWETWHSIILTPEQIKTSVGDRLLSCHTSEKKLKKKQAAFECAAENGDGGSAENGDGRSAENDDLNPSDYD